METPTSFPCRICGHVFSFKLPADVCPDCQLKRSIRCSKCHKIVEKLSRGKLCPNCITEEREMFREEQKQLSEKERTCPKCGRRCSRNLYGRVCKDCGKLGQVWPELVVECPKCHTYIKWKAPAGTPRFCTNPECATEFLNYNFSPDDYD